MTAGWTIVLDVGKTHSKATLWDDAGDCVAQRQRANPNALAPGDVLRFLG